MHQVRGRTPKLRLLRAGKGEEVLVPFRMGRQHLALQAERLHAQPLNALHRHVLRPDDAQAHRRLQCHRRQVERHGQRDHRVATSLSGARVLVEGRPQQRHAALELSSAQPPNRLHHAEAE